MKDDLGSVWGPTQRLQKKFEKTNRKWKVEKSCPQPYIHMVHYMQWQQPTAKTNQMASHLHIPIQCRKLRKVNFGPASCKSIAQAQAQKHASRQGKDHAENSKPSNIRASQRTKQAAKKPSNQADRHMQAARPATKKRETRSEQARQQASEPASMPAKQPGQQPARQPTKQPTSQKKNKNQQHRKAERHTETEILTAKQWLCWPHWLLTTHSFHKLTLLKNRWGRKARHASKKRSMT